MSSQWFKEKFQLNTIEDLKQLCQKSNVRLLEYTNSPLINLSYRDDCEYSNVFARCCRGLVLDKNTLAVVARPFSRFFNYHEYSQNLLLDFAMKDASFDCQALEKVDGTMVKLFCYQGTWLVGTRGSAFGENNVANTKIRYVDLFVWALQDKKLNANDVDNYTIKRKTLTENEICENDTYLQKFAENEQLNPELTYVFELCSPLNKVVIDYPVSLYFLGALHNSQDEFNDSSYLPVVNINDQNEDSTRQQLIDVALRQQSTIATVQSFKNIAIRYPKHYAFNRVEEIIATAKALSGEKGEGFIVTLNGLPKIKIKSPDFLLKSREINTLTPDKLFDIVFAFEESEWIANFPQDKDRINIYVQARDTLIKDAKAFFIATVCQSLNIAPEEVQIGENYVPQINDSSLMQNIFTKTSSQGVAVIASNLIKGKSIAGTLSKTKKNSRREWLLAVIGD